MTSRFVIKDSGARRTFQSGMVRDSDSEKICWSLITDGPLLYRWASHLTAGAKKYAARNWLKAEDRAELARFRESAFRHFMQWWHEETDEDHAAAVLFNMNGAEYVKARLSRRRRPRRRGRRC